MDKTVREQLLELAEENYQRFASSLIPNIHNVLGVRLPLLRIMAKAIAKGDWRSYMKHAENDYFEEVMLQGMVIGYVKCELEEKLRYVSDFVPKIDNWSVCDSFCIGLSFVKTNQERVWDFVQPYLLSKEEYELRFGVVMLLHFYVDPVYLPRVFERLDKIQHDGYYVKMAVAWALSICFVKDQQSTLEYLQISSLDDFTYNKTLQKITESNRVDAETKKGIRAMKRKQGKSPILT